MAEVNGYILVNVKTQEIITRTFLIIIRRLNICGPFEIFRNLSKGVGSINIDQLIDLQTISTIRDQLKIAAVHVHRTGRLLLRII